MALYIKLFNNFVKYCKFSNQAHMILSMFAKKILFNTKRVSISFQQESIYNKHTQTIQGVEIQQKNITYTKQNSNQMFKHINTNKHKSSVNNLQEKERTYLLPLLLLLNKNKISQERTLDKRKTKIFLTSKNKTLFNLQEPNINKNCH